MEVSTMSTWAATKVIATHNTSETFTLRGTSYVNFANLSKVSNGNFFTNSVLRSILYANLTQVANRLGAKLCKMTSHRLVDFVLLDGAKAKLYCLITIRVGGFDLAYFIRSSLDNGNRNNLAVLIEKLSHTDFFTVDSVNHYSITPLQLDLDVNTSRKIETHQRINGRRGWI